MRGEPVNLKAELTILRGQRDGLAERCRRLEEENARLRAALGAVQAALRGYVERERQA